MADHPADRAGREVAKSLKLGFYWVFFHFWRKGWDWPNHSFISYLRKQIAKKFAASTR